MDRPWTVDRLFELAACPNARFVHGGRSIERGETLARYGITPANALNVVHTLMRLRGGMHHASSLRAAPGPAAANGPGRTRTVGDFFPRGLNLQFCDVQCGAVAACALYAQAGGAQVPGGPCDLPLQNVQVRGPETAHGRAPVHSWADLVRFLHGLATGTSAAADGLRTAAGAPRCVASAQWRVMAGVVNRWAPEARGSVARVCEAADALLLRRDGQSDADLFAAVGAAARAATLATAHGQTEESPQPPHDT
jgi:hypothetical protein